MSLFHKDKKDDNDAPDVEHFFDEYFQEELRNHGRWYFEKVISENGTVFKQELDGTIERINNELKERIDGQLQASVAQINTTIQEHITNRLDAQFVDYAQVVKDAQDAALASLNKSAQTVLDQNQQLSTTLQTSIANQEETLKKTSEENIARLTAMKEQQDAALESLTRSAKAIEEQNELLIKTLQENVEKRQEVLINAFKDNMAQVIEHYLLGALGDQYNIQEQLPSIIGQLEANKQAIVDDMKL